MYFNFSRKKPEERKKGKFFFSFSYFDLYFLRHLLYEVEKKEKRAVDLPLDDYFMALAILATTRSVSSIPV